MPDDVELDIRVEPADVAKPADDGPTQCTRCVPHEQAPDPTTTR